MLLSDASSHWDRLPIESDGVVGLAAFAFTADRLAPLVLATALRLRRRTGRLGQRRATEARALFLKLVGDPRLPGRD